MVLLDHVIVSRAGGSSPLPAWQHTAVGTASRPFRGPSVVRPRTAPLPVTTGPLLPRLGMSRCFGVCRNRSPRLAGHWMPALRCPRRSLLHTWASSPARSPPTHSLTSLFCVPDLIRQRIDMGFCNRWIIYSPSGQPETGTEHSPGAYGPLSPLPLGEDPASFGL